jgi:hypothetical protein
LETAWQAQLVVTSFRTFALMNMSQEDQQRFIQEGFATLLAIRTTQTEIDVDLDDDTIDKQLDRMYELVNEHNRFVMLTASHIDLRKAVPLIGPQPEDKIPIADIQQESEAVVKAIIRDIKRIRLKYKEPI